MIELYSFPTPNGQKISIALEELALPYRTIPINIARNDQFMPEFLRISPNNRIPAIIDTEPGDDGKPIPIFESGAILIYLAEKTGRLLPTDKRGRTAVMQWLMWQMGGVGPMLGQAHHFRRFAPETIDYAVKRYTTEAARLYGVLDRQLQEREFVAGDYSIADIAIFPWISYFEMQGQRLEDFPSVQRWHQGIQQRPGVQRGLAAGSELWGNPPLDDDARRALFWRWD